MGDLIDIEGKSGTFKGYLARPAAGQASGKGVLVLQEWWGLVPHIQTIADRFAAAGYLALVPDLYHGQSTTRPDEAGRLLMALDIGRAEQDLRAAAATLGAHGARGKVGVIGFCMGGQLALLAATTNPAIGAAIDFYGVHPKVELDFAGLACPVLGLFGAKDASVSPAVVAKLVAAIEGAGKRIEHTIYATAGHAFFNDARPEAYDAVAAADAWQRSLGFLAANL